MFAEVTLKDAQKIHSGVVFEGMQESDVIVNQQPYSESSYLHDKEDSSVVSFIRNSSLISQNDFMVSTREGRESKYDVYQVKQPPKFVNKALDNLYASVITDMRKELPGTKKGRYISLDKLNNQLNPDHFFRANRQFILGIDAIKRVDPYFNSKMLVSVVPAYNGQIIVSKEKATQLKMWLNY